MCYRLTKSNQMKIIQILLLLFISQSMLAQDEQNITHIIPSKAFEKDRTIKVHLPQRYLSDTITKFAVTYVLDAQSDNFWNMAKSNISYLVGSYAVIPMIVVGISSDNRGSEFTPPCNTLNDHLRNEVFTLIAEKYRVNDFKTIIGHSWGGLYVGDALFGKNADMFDSYLALSPSFDYNDNIIVHRADSVLRARTSFKKSFYYTVGDLGRIEYENAPPAILLDSILKTHPNTTLDWQFKRMINHDHWTLVISSINEGLINLSRNYLIDTKVIADFVKINKTNIKTQIEVFYKNKQTNFGYIYEPSGKYFRYLADDYRDIEKYDIAMQIYQYAVAKSPDEITINMNIADTYHKMKNTSQEKMALEKTIALLEAQKADLKERFYTNCLKWAKDRLSKCE